MPIYDYDNNETSKLPFTDVKETDWFYEDIAYFYNKGLVNGTSETKFSPNKSLTRAEALALFRRILISERDK